MARLHRIRTSSFAFLGLLALGASASAQQLIHNTADVPSSAGSTENVDFADIDNDGDYDAAFADGGDAGNDQNKLWRNNGFAQGGTVGVFTNVTATQFPAVLDDSRDIEFVDFDADGDNDIYVSNTAQLSPNTNRWWANMGGIQAGTIGFYQDQTSSRWNGLGGAGSSIAPSQLNGGGFLDFSCDCDFGDLDNDGDLDLFHSSYGGALGGNVPSRIFLNNGAGIFTEFNPSGFQLSGQTISNGNPGIWCQGVQTANTTNATGANCDIASSALDIDFGDIDGDFDLDILHGARQELPRMFQNRYAENGNVMGPMRDVTGSTFTGTYSTGNGHYEQEMGDQDGDGDIDIYGLNWLVNINFDDIVTKNNGSGVFGAVVTLSNSQSDDNEADYFDYDNDGDLDVFVANFSGQDRVYRNGGTGSYTFQTTGVVVPTDGTTSLDADGCDVDNDGDEDVFVANDAGQAEWYLQNTTTANDTFAPYIPRMEQAPTRIASATPSVVRFWVGDNHAYYVIAYYAASIDVQVNAGPITTYPARTMWGQQFRCEIPGNLVGTITYTAHCTDRYGNTGASATKTYFASNGASAMISFCDPGQGSILPCPCTNPPAGLGQGCDNSSATGGAALSAIGVPSLAADSVLFTTTGEKPTATSIVLQGNSPSATGVVFGQGIRCAAGTLKRLYTKTAIGGSISAPTGLDQSVSARSASLGDTITAGTSRYYGVYYRDPVVLGGCPGASTFNITQAGQVDWTP